MKLLKSKNIGIYFFITFSLFFFIKKSSAQLKKAEIIGAYIYNFAKHTEIEKCKSFETYNIVLISENPEITSEFRKVVTKDKIQGKPIYINIHNNAEVNFNDACIIFIAEDKSDLYPEIYEKTKNKQVLLVTENYYDKRKIMLNLTITKDDRINFEINKANIYERNINISEEMLLFGGSEVDIIELYLQSKKDLIESETNLKVIQLKVNELKSQFSEIEQKVILQNNQLRKQISLIEEQKNEKDNLITEIEGNINEIKQQNVSIKNEKIKLTLLIDSLHSNKLLFEKQKQELNYGYEALQNLKDEIRKKNTEIKVQESSLGQQYDIISKNKKINQLFIVIIILFFLLALILLGDVLYRKRKNKLLKKQQEEIKNKNLTISDHLEKKKLINDLLKTKNRELSGIIEKLKKTQQQLIQSEKMASLGILTAGIAHEINNPINFVYTGINSLQKDFKDIEVIINKIKDLKPDDENLQEKISEIQSLKKEYYFDEAVGAIPQTIIDISIGASRTAEIVDGLRKFSRMGENKFVLSDIHEFIQTALLILKNKYKNIIKIERIFCENAPKIKCNPGKITQVFLNIIYNSIDAINEKENTKGKIIITTSLINDKIKISIKDNGVGIKDKIKKKIFDPFFTTKDVGRGTGLGLSISFGIIEEHKGEIKVISEKGKGTEFIIILPLKN